MLKKENKLKKIQNLIESEIKTTNIKIEELGGMSSKIYSLLNELQVYFNLIRNVPNENHIQVQNLNRVRSDWQQQVVEIEKDYKLSITKSTGAAVSGAGAGAAVVTLGPTAAMGVATTFGVASTGTAISSLSGAAATNAALAWLGGGAIATGGSGIAGGSAFLTLAGPVGWAIAGVTLAGSGVFFWQSKLNTERLEQIFELISNRDEQSYKAARVEINERMSRINDESEKLQEAIEKVRTFGVDYNSMSEEQQYELGAYVNLMGASTQLLVNPILGLQPKYSSADYEVYLESPECVIEKDENDSSIKKLIVAVANLLYKIELSEKDKKVLWKVLKKNKEFISSINITKNEFDFDIMKKVDAALEYKYN